MRYIIDRWEGDYGILENEQGEMEQILRKNLPPQAREGDVLSWDGGVYRIEEEETRVRRARVEEKMKRLWADQ